MMLDDFYSVGVGTVSETEQAATSTTTTSETKQRWKAFVAWAEPDAAEARDQLAIMLDKAGFEVFPNEPRPETEEAFRQAVARNLAGAHCSFHVLGAAYGDIMRTEDASASFARFQYVAAAGQAPVSGSAFRRVVWTLPTEGLILEGDQQDFITQIQNSLSEDTFLSNVASAQRFIQDSVSFLESREERPPVAKEYDIAFISNVMDAADCYHLIEGLAPEFRMQTLTVVPEKDVDYRAQAAEIILRSRLAVVYFTEASDWAISFVKQIWKQVGGVSSGVSFLVIGEDEPRRNRFLKFRAPQVELVVVPKAEVAGKIRQFQARVASEGRISDEVFSPYTGLRPFNEDESVFFKGREKHINFIINALAQHKFSMVTGSSGDGKSSLLYAGVIPSLKGGFLKSQYTKWAVADFRPERTPLKNLSAAIAQNLRIRNQDEVEHALSYGFSALVDLYKQSSLYCDTTSDEWQNANEEHRKLMRRQASNLLILVDQFEEFFTNLENFRDGVASPVAQITINVLLETIRIAREEDLPIYVVFTMRSDYIGQCVAFRGFAEMIGHSTYFVPRLKRDEIQEVIEAPAKLNGNKISNRLVQRILNDVGDGLDQLPMLQHCMHQIWTVANRGQETLDMVHFAKVGGLSASKLPIEDRTRFQTWFEALPQETKALYEKPKLRNVLNRHANELFNSAFAYYNERAEEKISREDARFVLQVAFTGLTKIDENRAVRNRMSLQEITDLLGRPEFNTQVVNRVLNIFRAAGNTFVQPYMLQPNEAELAPNAVLDITHEALIRNWDRLVEWAENEYRSVSIYTDFKVQVNRWLAEDCSPTYLLNSGTYQYFNAWYDRQKPTPAWIRRYIRPDEVRPEMDALEQATLYLEDIIEFLERSRQRIERNKRLILFVIALISVLFLAALAAAFWANEQRAEAERQRMEAEAARDEADRQRMIADWNANEATIARLNAEIQAIRAEEQALIANFERKVAVTERERAEFEKQRAEQQAEIARKQTELAQREKRRAEMEAQAAMRATRDAVRNEFVARIQTENARINLANAQVAQSMFLSSLSEEQTLANDDPLVGLELARQALPDDIHNPSRPFVPEAEAKLYLALDAVLNRLPQTVLSGHKNNVVSARYSPDGRRIITTSWDMSARVWDAVTGQQLHKFQGHNHIVNKAFFSPDGNRVVTVAEDFSARLWNVQTGGQLASYTGHDNSLTWAALSPTNDRVLTTSTDNTARIFDAATGRSLSRLAAHLGPVLMGAFSPNGRYVLTTSADRTARVWDTYSGGLLATLDGHRGQVNFAAFSPNSRYIATVSTDMIVRLWDAASGRMIHQMVGHTAAVTYAAFSHDGRKVVTTSADNTARVWDVNTGAMLGTLREHTAPVYHAAFSPDDQRIVTSSDDRSARLWDGASYLRLAFYTNLPPTPFPAAFSPDSRKLVVAQDRPHSLRIYKVFPPRQALIDLARTEVNAPPLTSRQRQQFYLQGSQMQRELDTEREMQSLNLEEEVQRRLERNRQEMQRQNNGNN